MSVLDTALVTYQILLVDSVNKPILLSRQNPVFRLYLIYPAIILNYPAHIFFLFNKQEIMALVSQNIR